MTEHTTIVVLPIMFNREEADEPWSPRRDWLAILRRGQRGI